MLKLHFATRDSTIESPAGRTLHEEVIRMGHVLDQACGGNALCGTCCVLVVDGEEHLSSPDKREAERLRELRLPPPYRLACQARIKDEDGEICIVAC